MSFHDFIERAWAYGVKPRSRRKITAQQMYPWAVERQLQADLKAEFVKAGMYYKEQALKGTQSFKDNADDLADAQYDNDERIRPLAERVAYEVEKFQQASFENFSDVVIGERYIPAVVGPSITDTWQENFLTLCRSTNDDLKRRVSAIISDAVMNGKNIADTAGLIDEAVGHYSYSKAMTIARTETGKLNMAISKAQMEEAGIDKYEWSCMMDERSRPSHEKMDGKICIWSNPNVVYNIKTKKTEPRLQSAVHLHPGDDYNCRCVALPWDELIEDELNQKKGKPNKQWLELKEQEAENRRIKELKRTSEKKLSSQLNGIGEMLDSIINREPFLQLNRPVIEFQNAVKEVLATQRFIDKPFDVKSDTERIMGKVGAKKNAKPPVDFNDVNPSYEVSNIFQENCAHVVTAAEMQYRGYSVLAEPLYKFDGNHYLGDFENGIPNLTKAFSNATTLRFQSLSTIRSKMKEWGDGSRAFVGFQYKDNNGGHVIMAIQEKGQTVFKDFQCDRSIKELVPYVNFLDPYNFFFRVDNLSPTEVVIKVVRAKK